MEKLNKFTDKKLAVIKPSAKLSDYKETSGLMLRVYPTGIKTWMYYFKFEDKPVRMKLGYYPALSLAEARKAYSDASLLKDKGINPKGNGEIHTIKDLSLEFIKYIKKERSRPEIVEQLLNKNIVPALGHILLKDITTVRLTAVLKKVAKRAPVSANRTLSVTKQMFGYATQIGYIKDNPLRDTKSKVIGGAEVVRERQLSFKEIKTLWYWLDDNSHKIHLNTVNAIKILLLTGVRSGELRAAEWGEFDFSNSLWTIPAEKTKTGIIHRVHLSLMVIELFERMQSTSKFVMPSAKEDKPINDKALSRAVSRIQGRIEGINEQWTPHDLRRTFASHLDDLGIEPYVTQKCLGHAMPRIFATYSKSEYLPKRKEALNMWARHIEALVLSDNVVLRKNT